MFNQDYFQAEQKIAQERYQVIVESRQVAKAAAVNPIDKPALHRRALTGLGRRLVSWGAHLQARSDTTAYTADC
jgi:hypothetical protein